MRKIWECNEVYFCPITGYCLSPLEQKTLVSKTPIELRKQIRKNETHEFLIASTSKKTALAKQIQKLLDKKYQKEISLYWKYDNSQWLKKVDNFLDIENFGAFIWISAIYKNLNEKENHFIQHIIHEYGHQLYFEYQKLSKKHSDTSFEYESSQEKYKSIRSKQKLYEKEIKLLNSNNSGLKHENQKLVKENKVLKQKKEDDNKDSYIELLEHRLREHNQTIINFKAENKSLNKRTESQKSFVIKMNRDFAEVLALIKEQNSECASCEKVNLCKRRVLIVGGMTKMESYYKQLVEEMGGQFLYHDGYCKQKEAVLSNLIKQSDIVICPVDINSHAACLNVKHTCKELGREYHMLRKSSISTIFNTLKGSV